MVNNNHNRNNNHKPSNNHTPILLAKLIHLLDPIQPYTSTL